MTHDMCLTAEGQKASRIPSVYSILSIKTTLRNPQIWGQIPGSPTVLALTGCVQVEAGRVPEGRTPHGGFSTWGSQRSELQERSFIFTEQRVWKTTDSFSTSIMFVTFIEAPTYNFSQKSLLVLRWTLITGYFQFSLKKQNQESFFNILFIFCSLELFSLWTSCWQTDSWVLNWISQFSEAVLL